MCAGTREDGSQIEPNDPHWDRLTKIAAAARHRPLAWLEMEEIYGGLAQDTNFAPIFESWLSSIYETGLEATIKRYLDMHNAA